MISFARTGLKNLSAFVKDFFGGFLPLTPLSNAGYPTNSDFTSVVPRLSYDVIPYVGKGQLAISYLEKGLLNAFRPCFSTKKEMKNTQSDHRGVQFVNGSNAMADHSIALLTKKIMFGFSYTSEAMRRLNIYLAGKNPKLINGYNNIDYEQFVKDQVQKILKSVKIDKRNKYNSKVDVTKIPLKNQFVCTLRIQTVKGQICHIVYSLKAPSSQSAQLQAAIFILKILRQLGVKNIQIQSTKKSLFFYANGWLDPTTMHLESLFSQMESLKKNFKYAKFTYDKTNDRQPFK